MMRKLTKAVEAIRAQAREMWQRRLGAVFVTQWPTHPCVCGVRAQVEATSSPWEFTYVCWRCGRCGVVSHFHGAPPPVFEPSPAETQGVLRW